MIFLLSLCKVLIKFIGYGVVSPPELCRGLFTTSVMDNLDHHPSSSTSTSFYGTSISISQNATHKNDEKSRRNFK